MRCSMFPEAWLSKIRSGEKQDLQGRFRYFGISAVPRLGNNVALRTSRDAYQTGIARQIADVRCLFNHDDASED